MISLDNNALQVNFSEHFPGAKGSISFMRTLRLPDNEHTHHLPAGLGPFRLRHIEDSQGLPNEWLKKGGVLLPIYQAEAMWINFSADYPIALKIGCGKINAINGKPWTSELLEDEQDYIVIPGQKWIDGFSISKDIVRQFVAMPLGMGITVEEQLTEFAEHGGIQIMAYPMKCERYQLIQNEREEAEALIQRQRAKLNAARQRMLKIREILQSELSCEEREALKKELSDLAFEFRGVRNSSSGKNLHVFRCMNGPAPLGLAAGAKIKQEIHKDPFGYDAWDSSQQVRCFVHLLNSEQWFTHTNECMPRPPISISEYRQAGIPWFDYYSDNEALEGPKVEGIKSISEFGLFNEDSENQQSVDDDHPVLISTKKLSEECL